MAKHSKADRDTAALFVRLPLEEADKLDRVAFRLKAPKREVIRQLLSGLDPDAADVLWHRPSPAPLPPTPVTAPPPGSELVVGRADLARVDPADVLDAAGAAELLRTDEAAVVGLAESGELPGRRVGGEWRFLRRAVLAWLGDAPAAQEP
jgi:excisionase family DNA binding protein